MLLFSTLFDLFPDTLCSFAFLVAWLKFTPWNVNLSACKPFFKNQNLVYKIDTDAKYLIILKGTYNIHSCRFLFFPLNILHVTLFYNTSIFSKLISWK